MQRGILLLTKDESIALLNNFDINKYPNTPLFNKLSSLENGHAEGTDYQILLSEEEVETILDEIGCPTYIEGDPFTTAMKKICDLMYSFRD